MDKQNFEWMIRRLRDIQGNNERVLELHTIRKLDGAGGVRRHKEQIRKKKNKNRRKDID